MKKTLFSILAGLVILSSSIAQNKNIVLKGNFDHDKAGTIETAVYSGGVEIRVPELKDLYLGFRPDSVYVEKRKGKDYLIVENRQEGIRKIYKFNGIWEATREQLSHSK